MRHEKRKNKQVSKEETAGAAKKRNDIRTAKLPGCGNDEQKREYQAFIDTPMMEGA